MFRFCILSYYSVVLLPSFMYLGCSFVLIGREQVTGKVLSMAEAYCSSLSWREHCEDFRTSSPCRCAASWCCSMLWPVWRLACAPKSMMHGSQERFFYFWRPVATWAAVFNLWGSFSRTARSKPSSRSATAGTYVVNATGVGPRYLARIESLA